MFQYLNSNRAKAGLKFEDGLKVSLSHFPLQPHADANPSCYFVGPQKV